MRMRRVGIEGGIGQVVGVQRFWRNRNQLRQILNSHGQWTKRQWSPRWSTADKKNIRCAYTADTNTTGPSNRRYPGTLKYPRYYGRYSCRFTTGTHPSKLNLSINSANIIKICHFTKSCKFTQIASKFELWLINTPVTKFIQKTTEYSNSPHF